MKNLHDTHEAVNSENGSRICSGLSVQQSRLYWVWLSMRSRCHRERDKDYSRYGGRGIRMCDEWKGNFNTFATWAFGNGYQPGLTIDRRNNDLGYSPNNCRWVTQAVNKRNSSNAKPVAAFGETKCVAEWAEDARCVVKYDTLKYRLQNGWNPEFAITAKAQLGLPLRMRKLVSRA